MKDSYIHIGDFEKYVRNRFKNIVNGKGSVIPRIAVKMALDDIFAEESPPEPVVEADVCEFCAESASYEAETCYICGRALRTA